MGEGMNRWAGGWIKERTVGGMGRQASEGTDG